MTLKPTHTVKLPQQWMGIPEGTKLVISLNSYEENICDCCGQKRMCDWFEWEDGGLDLCRKCAKKWATEDW